VTEWVQKHGTAVKESDYSSASASDSSGSDGDANSSSQSGRSTSTIYRLDPSDVS
jgi:hypothetical protein